MLKLYKTKAVNYGGRDGHVKVEDSDLEFDMALPSVLGKAVKTGVNPEQLFAAAFSACFGNAVQHVARVKHMKMDSYALAVEIGLGPDPEGGIKLSADITLSVIGLTQPEADELIQEAHKTCPYSKATRGNIDVKLKALAG
jgi:osmotically inducible protein OsmC